jgi:probable phosphoglycerate mutase
MSRTDSLRVTINADGGARGNPGPAAAGVVIRSADDGTVLHEAGIFLGKKTNNFAEYAALLAGLEAAARLGATEAEVLSDSELLVKQMNGEYRVRNAALKSMFEQAWRLAGKLRRFSVHHVGREENQCADLLVNRAINLKRNVEDAAD